MVGLMLRKVTFHGLMSPSSVGEGTMVQTAWLFPFSSRNHERLLSLRPKPDSTLVIWVLCVWLNALLESSHLPRWVWLIFIGKELQDKADRRFLLPISVGFAFVFPVLYVFEEKYWVAYNEQHLWQILLLPSSLKGRKSFGFYRQKDKNEFILCFEPCQWLITLPASEEQKWYPEVIFGPHFTTGEPAQR